MEDQVLDEKIILRLFLGWLFNGVVSVETIASTKVHDVEMYVDMNRE
jgi:hypothetical protein